MRLSARSDFVGKVMCVCMEECGGVNWSNIWTRFSKAMETLYFCNCYSYDYVLLLIFWVAFVDRWLEVGQYYVSTFHVSIRAIYSYIKASLELDLFSSLRVLNFKKLSLICSWSIMVTYNTVIFPTKLSTTNRTFETLYVVMDDSDVLKCVCLSAETTTASITWITTVQVYVIVTRRSVVCNWSTWWSRIIEQLLLWFVASRWIQKLINGW